LQEVKKKLLLIKGNDKYPIINYLLLFAFLVLISVITTFKLFQDDDVFWHLATGRYIIQNGQIPSSDVFGFISGGMKWIPFEWGWDVITFMIYSIGGFYALSVFRTVIVLSIFFIIILILRKQNLSFSVIIPFSILLIFGILTRLSIRPQIATYFFLILIIYIFFRHKYNNTGEKKFLFLMPSIFLIWANIHMGVLTGILIFALYCISELIETFIINRKNISEELIRKIKFLVITFIISAAVLLINPNFINTYIYTFKHSQMDLLEQINEWKSPFSSSNIYYYNVIIYLFFLITGLVIFYYSFRKKELFPVLVYIVIGIYSIQAMRFITDFMITIFIFWMISISFLTSKFNFDKVIENIISKTIIFIGIIYLIFNIYNNTIYKEYLGNYFRETGFGVNENFFPKKMFDFITKENIDKIGSRPFNNLKIGGYFIWNIPENKNFIDSRNLNDSLYYLYKNIDLKKYGFELLLEKLNVDYVIYSTPYLIYNPGEIEKNIISYLAEENNKWKLVYWDDRSFLFVKNIPKFKDIISQFEYKFVSPYNFLFEQKTLNEKYISDRLAVTGELRRKLIEEPDGKIINDIAENFKKVY
jgi:hypothetical protein